MNLIVILIGLLSLFLLSYNSIIIMMILVILINVGAFYAKSN
jgi:hypothetical protein